MSRSKLEDREGDRFIRCSSCSVEQGQGEVTGVRAIAGKGAAGEVPLVHRIPSLRDKRLPRLPYLLSLSCIARFSSLQACTNLELATAIYVKAYRELLVILLDWPLMESIHVSRQAYKKYTVLRES